MSLLMGVMKKKLDGHKMLTKNKDLLVYNPKTVAIPLVHMGSKEYELYVKEGDDVKVGQLLAARNDHFYIPFYSSVSGKILKIDKVISSTLAKVDHLIIESDDKFIKVEKKAKIDVDKATREELIDYTKKMGIVGLGGAGFPMYFKYQSDKINTLVINAVECEPYLTSDCHNLVMDEEHGYLKVGIEAAIKMGNISKVIYAVKKYEDTDVEDIITYYQSLNPKIEVKFVKDRYPNGWERTLVYTLFKKRYDKLPNELGIVVNNPSTLIALGEAIDNGYGIVRKTVTVAGDAIDNSTTVSVPVGTVASDIIDKLGGYNCDDLYLVSGGPMMGTAIPNDKWVVDLCNNGIVVMKDQQKGPTIECLSCGSCTKNCPAGLQPVIIARHGKVKDKETLKKLGALDCVECGLCTFVCPSNIEVTEEVRKAKRLIR